VVIQANQFVPKDRYGIRCRDPESHLLSVGGNQGDPDVIADHHFFTDSAREHQHASSSLGGFF